MPCTGRFADAWQFAAMMCVGAILSGSDNSGGAGNAMLTDSTVDFATFGVEANVGMILYNTTQSTNGPVTAVTTHTVTATGVTWDNGDAYRIVTISAQERSAIEHYLNIAATDIHAAMAASGMCDCTLASWAADYLAKLNIIDAVVIQRCTCGGVNLTPGEREMWLNWITSQLELIRTGKIELCSGETGSEFPAFGSIEKSLTEWSGAEIALNARLRNL